MRNREVYLFEDETMGVAATRIVNLDFSNPLVALDFHVRGKRTDKDAYTNNILISLGVSKIEVVDGSDVLFSMDMAEAMALQRYANNEVPKMLIDAVDNGMNDAHVKIRFGRDDSDQEWMLDPRKFVNPQIKITYNLPVGALNYVAGQQTMTLKATVCENPTTDPMGFLMAKHIYQWNKAAAGDETIDMPRDYLYRLLMLRVYDGVFSAHSEFKRWKLSCDIDRFVPFEIAGDDLSKKEIERYGLGSNVSGATGDDPNQNYVWHPFGYSQGMAQFGCGAGGAMYVRGSSPWRNLPSLAADASIEAARYTEWNCFGYEYNNHMPYPFGNLRDVQEFFDPTSFKSVRLIITQDKTADLDSGVVLQQVRTY